MAASLLANTFALEMLSLSIHHGLELGLVFAPTVARQNPCDITSCKAIIARPDRVLETIDANVMLHLLKSSVKLLGDPSGVFLTDGGRKLRAKLRDLGKETCLV